MPVLSFMTKSSDQMRPGTPRPIIVPLSVQGTGLTEETFTLRSNPEILISGKNFPL